mgnify:CR=1 FL=1|tara:strand:- start:626 stop:829 length:204 start_codon:yes stop_codon:yes gene_type:complete
MEYTIKEKKLEEFVETINELEKLLTQRISDLHEVKGGVQSRHAYCYYRKLLWEAKYLIRDNAKLTKE